MPKLADLDDPARLVLDHLRPSSIATRERSVTHGIALEYFEQGETGLLWWSTLEASWTNVTLFAERLTDLPRMTAVTELSVVHPVVREAAEFLAIDIVPPGRRTATRRY